MARGRRRTLKGRGAVWFRAARVAEWREVPELDRITSQLPSRRLQLEGLLPDQGLKRGDLGLALRQHVGGIDLLEGARFVLLQSDPDQIVADVVRPGEFVEGGTGVVLLNDPGRLKAVLWRRWQRMGSPCSESPAPGSTAHILPPSLPLKRRQSTRRRSPCRVPPSRRPMV